MELLENETSVSVLALNVTVGAFPEGSKPCPEIVIWVNPLLTETLSMTGMNVVAERLLAGSNIRQTADQTRTSRNLFDAIAAIFFMSPSLFRWPAIGSCLVGPPDSVLKSSCPNFLKRKRRTKNRRGEKKILGQEGEKELIPHSYRLENRWNQLKKV